MAKVSAILTLFLVALLSLFCSLSVAFPNPSVTLVKRYAGRASYFSPGLGACGKRNSERDLIVALPAKSFESGIHCDKKIKITHSKTGNKHTATVRDKCPSCFEGDLDMSPSLFKALAGDLDVGVFQMTWQFI